jgi:hypothetical protein
VHPFLETAAAAQLTVVNYDPVIIIACSPAAWQAYHVVHKEGDKDHFLRNCMRCGYAHFKTGAGGGVVELCGLGGVIMIDCGHYRGTDGRILVIMTEREEDEMDMEDGEALMIEMRAHHREVEAKKGELEAKRIKLPVPKVWYDGRKDQGFSN